MKLHDEGDGSAIGVGNMESAALRHGSSCASCPELFGSGRQELSRSGRHELSRSSRCHELSRSGHHELSGSGRHELSRSGRHALSGSSHRLEGTASPRSLVGYPYRDNPTDKHRGLPRRHSRVRARLGLTGLGTVATVDDRPYTCADCSMTFGRETALCGHMRLHNHDHLFYESEEDVRGAALHRGSPHASCPELSRSGCHKLSGSGHHELSRSGRHDLSEFGCHELSRSGCHDLSGSGHHELSGSNHYLEGNASPRSLVGYLGRDKPSTEQHGLPRHHSRVVTRPGLAGLGTIAAVDDRPYTCVDCCMTFGRETALCGHMRSHKRDHVSSDSEEDSHTPNKRRKKRKSKQRTVMPLEATWGNRASRSGTPRDAPAEVKVSRTESIVTVPNIAAAMHESNKVIENDDNSDDISVILIDNDDDDDGNPVIAVVGSHGTPSPDSDAAAALAMAPAPAMAMPTPTPAPHAAAASLNTEGAPAATSAVAVTIPPALASAVATHQALGGHVTSYHRIMEKKGKAKLDLQSGLHMCKVCNHMCQTGHELSFHMICVHPHLAIATAAASASSSANKEKDFVTEGNNIGTAVDGPYNTVGRQIPASAPTSTILTLPASVAPVHQPPQGMMVMAGNPMTGHFSAANNSTGWSLLGTTSSILPATPLHNEELNPLEQIPAIALRNHRHHSISPALFSFPRRQEIAVVPGNAIASSSSTPRPGMEPSQFIGINNHYAAIHAPANTLGRHLPFFQAGRNHTQASPVSSLVHHPTQGMAMDGNLLTGHFPAATSATGWSFPATTNSVLRSIPLQNQEVNNNVAAIDALANTMPCLPFFLTGRSAIHAPPMSMPVHQPTQGIVAMAGNPVAGHFPAAMAGDWYSFPATTSSVLPAIPLQTQEENPPQGRVVPANGEHPSTCLIGSKTFSTFP